MAGSETDGGREDAYTVAGLIGGLKRLLAERVGRVWVVGELSDVHVARSGHVYFSLVEDACRVRCALFRSGFHGAPRVLSLRVKAFRRVRWVRVRVEVGRVDSGWALQLGVALASMLAASSLSRSKG